MSMPLGLAEYVARGERSLSERENITRTYTYINERLRELAAKKRELDDDEYLLITHKRQLEVEFRKSNLLFLNDKS